MGEGIQVNGNETLDFKNAGHEVEFSIQAGNEAQDSYTQVASDLNDKTTLGDLYGSQRKISQADQKNNVAQETAKKSTNSKNQVAKGLGGN